MNTPSPRASMIDFNSAPNAPIFDLEMMHHIDDSSSIESDESTLEYDSDDELERIEAFSAVKRHSLELISSRRFDEFGDFLSRSERTRTSVAGSTKFSFDTIGGSHRRVSQEAQRVRFVDDEDMTTVHHLEPYTRDEIRSCFLNRIEYKEIDLDCERTEKLMVKYQSVGIEYDENSMCFRGLESELSAEKRRDLQERHKNAVLREELRQRARDEYLNWRKIASVSNKFSSDSRLKAESLGKRDEQCRIEVWGGERRKANKDKPLMPIRRFRNFRNAGR